MLDTSAKAQRTDLARRYIGIAARNCALLKPCTFFSVEIEMILFAKTEETESIFQFALSVRKQKAWRHKTENRTIEKQRVWPQKLKHAHFQFQFAENWKTERL